MHAIPTVDDIRAAAERIRPYVHRTPVMTSRSIDGITGGTLYFKCENLQKAGAFKARGAVNAVMSLPQEEAAAGVATHSSGNHAAAVAYAARLRGVKAYIVMPDDAACVKREAVAGYGGMITFCEPTLAAREAALAGIVARTGAAAIHPYNDHRVIAGQGTAALELLEQTGELDVVTAPVGGGGLASGTALVVRTLAPRARMLGAEPAGADDAYRSLLAGRIVPCAHPQTIADGLRASLGEKTFAILRTHVHEIVTVGEDAIVAAMRLVWERMKLVIEPSAAVPLGAILSGRLDVKGRRIGVVLSGGNVDLDRLPWSPPRASRLPE